PRSIVSCSAWLTPRLLLVAPDVGNSTSAQHPLASHAPAARSALLSAREPLLSSFPAPPARSTAPLPHTAPARRRPARRTAAGGACRPWGRGWERARRTAPR